MRRTLLGRFDVPTLLLAGTAVLIAAAYWGIVTLSEDYYLIDAPPGSTFSSSDGGLKVLYQYLDGLGYERETLQGFDELPGGGTIVVAAEEPLERQPTPAEVRRLREWVERGGSLVLVGPYADDIMLGEMGGSRQSGKETAQLEPLLPGVLADGVERVKVGPDRLLMSGTEWVTHLKDEQGQVLVSRASGQGHVAWLSSLVPMSNDGIGEADNARLATLLVASAKGPIRFDEYHHGFVRGGGVWERLGAGGRSALVLGLLAATALVWSGSRRLGPVIEAQPEHEARTGAYIGSLAELYRKAGARPEALRTLADGLRAALARRWGDAETGLAREPEIAALLARVSSAGEMTESEFVATAREIARARREVEGRDG